MKFTNKQPQYQSKISPYATYLNSYVKDGKINIGEKKEYLSVQYLFCHTIDETQIIDEVEKIVQKEVVINRSELRFTEAHAPTFMTLENGDRVEVYEAILTGETYDKTKIEKGDWGKPDLHKVFQMFKPESMTNKETGLQIQDFETITVNGQPFEINPQQAAQIKQLIVDWLEQAVIIENEKLGINFQIQ